MANLDIPLDKRQWLYRRDLLRELIIRTIKIRYKSSFFGILWSLIYAIAQVRVFAFLFRTGLGQDIPNFPAYVFMGIMVWHWFQASLTQASEAITGNRELIRRPGFPVIILPVVTIATTMIDFLIAIPVLLVFLIAGGSPLSSIVILLPAIMALQFLFSLSLAYVFATFQVTFRDTKHILNVALRLGFFLTPIFYNPARLIPEAYQWLYRLNPIVHLIEIYRAIILDGSLPQPISLLFLISLLIIFLPLGYSLFTQAKYRFLEEL